MHWHCREGDGQPLRAQNKKKIIHARDAMARCCMMQETNARPVPSLGDAVARFQTGHWSEGLYNHRRMT